MAEEQRHRGTWNSRDRLKGAKAAGKKAAKLAGEIVLYTICCPGICLFLGYGAYVYFSPFGTPTQRRKRARDRQQEHKLRNFDSLKPTVTREEVFLCYEDESCYDNTRAKNLSVTTVARSESCNVQRGKPLSGDSNSTTVTKKEFVHFDFLALPREVQLLILQHVVLRDATKQWTASASINKGGFRFYCVNPRGDPTAHIRHSPLWTNHGLFADVTLNEELAMWRTNHTRTTMSLLLCCKAICKLTLETLDHSFSGTLRLRGRVRTSQLDFAWPWYQLTRDAPIIAHSRWLFDRIRKLETHHCREVWEGMLDVMPNLEHVILVNGGRLHVLDPPPGLPHIFAECHVDHAQPGGQFDHQAVQICLEAGRRWAAWAEERNEAGEHRVRITVKLTGYCKDYRSRSEYLIDHVEVWPNAGKSLLDTLQQNGVVRPAIDTNIRRS